MKPEYLTLPPRTECPHPHQPPLIGRFAVLCVLALAAAVLAWITLLR